MYYKKIIQRATHFKLKLKRLHGALKQFIKITEYAQEGKLHPTKISKAQLQEVVTEIYTNIKDYEFLIPTPHIRAELLWPIGKTDIKITSQKLLTLVDIPLLDRKMMELYNTSLNKFPA